MGKSADAFRTISEVAEWLGIPTHVLRFWESKFSQIKPVKRAGGRRYYRPNDMLLLGGIKKLLHDDGMTIKGVQKILRKDGIGPVAEHSQPLDDVTAAEFKEIADKAESDPIKPSTEQVSDFQSENTPPPTPAGPEADPVAMPVSAKTANSATAEPEPQTTEPALPIAPKSEQDAAPPPSKSEPTPADASQKPALPGLASKPQETDATPTREKTDPPADPPATPAPAPALSPAEITVPDDPDDSITAAPGLLGQLAKLPHPLPPDLASELIPVIARLRKISKADNPASKS